MFGVVFLLITFNTNAYEEIIYRFGVGRTLYNAVRVTRRRIGQTYVKKLKRARFCVI